jgi:catechol 2,3-dioxygenase-like lactoylglutathione lyase family enzyme
MAAVLRADHYMIVCTDPAKTADFLVKVVGLDQTPSDPERFSAADGFEVHICPVTAFDPNIHKHNWMPDGLPAFSDSFASRATHLCFRVDSLQDVLTRIFAYGGIQPFSLNVECAVDQITSATQPLTFGSRSVYVKDPDQNLFEFVQAGISLEAANLK